MSAPQVTPAMVEAQISHCFYANLGEAENAKWPDQGARDQFHPALDMITTCTLVTKNGHSVVGVAYCADPAKFNAQTGCEAARADAIRQLWPMVVYAERERLAQEAHPTPRLVGADVTLWTPTPELYDQLDRLTPGTSLRVVGDFRGQLVDITIPATEPTEAEIRARKAAASPLQMVLTPTPEQLAELREAVRNAPTMPIVLEPEPATAWTVIDPANLDTLPAKGFWLVTVDTDIGREVLVLEHEGKNKWLHDGEYTFQHSYMVRPIAWAPRPEAYAGEVLE